MSDTARPFPSGFLFGAATAAYQIEGAATADGKGESIWDRFCAKPGVISDGSSGAVACDHYRRWPEDIALMKAMNLGAGPGLAARELFGLAAREAQQPDLRRRPVAAGARPARESPTP